MQVKMPQLRPEMDKGLLVAWLKNPGDKVDQGDPLYEIESDKVVSQIAADCGGTLTQQLAEEGDEVQVDQVVAIIE